MSSGALSGLMTAILTVLFVGIWIWAWSARRKSQFDEMARLPLEDDDEVRR
jgi:cytochrome c oxidase cbb3-type subunit IV